MGSAPASLSAFKVTVGSGGTSFLGLQVVRVHGETHGASGFPPLKTRIKEDFVKAFCFGCGFHFLGAGYYQSGDTFRHFSAFCYGCGGSKVFDSTVGTGADEGKVNGDL